MNQVARALAPEFPLVAVDTLAYQYSQPPPTITKPEPNVIIRLCDISSNMGAPLTDPSNAGETFPFFSRRFPQEKKDIMIYQARLGTNIGKTLKKSPFSRSFCRGDRWVERHHQAHLHLELRGGKYITVHKIAELSTGDSHQAIMDPDLPRQAPDRKRKNDSLTHVFLFCSKIANRISDRLSRPFRTGA